MSADNGGSGFVSGPRPHSTSIDDVIEQTRGFAPPSGEPAPSAVPTEPSAVPTALRSPRRTLRLGKKGVGGESHLLFAIGLALLLWGGVMLLDHFGPTIQRDARITDVDSSRDSKGHHSYSVDGFDVAGGEFSTDVSERTYRQASVGDDVTVTRAWLTGRVTAIDGPDWRLDGSRMLWLHCIAAALGVGFVIWSIRGLRRYAALHPDEPGPLRRIRWGTVIVLVAVTVWIVYERSDSNVGGAAPRPSPAAVSR